MSSDDGERVDPFTWMHRPEQERLEEFHTDAGEEHRLLNVENVELSLENDLDTTDGLESVHMFDVADDGDADPGDRQPLLLDHAREYTCEFTVRLERVDVATCPSCSAAVEIPDPALLTWLETDPVCTECGHALLLVRPESVGAYNPSSRDSDGNVDGWV